jgi:hypothetical protein
MDVAIAEGKVAQVAEDIPARAARKVVDATDLIVAPGLIDIHAHVFVGPRPNAFAGGFSSVSHGGYGESAVGERRLPIRRGRHALVSGAIRRRVIASSALLHPVGLRPRVEVRGAARGR